MTSNNKKNAVKPTLQDLFTSPANFFGLGLGSGLSPIMPGTAGTLAAIIPYLFLQYLPLTSYLFVIVITALVGIKICDATAKSLGVHDHGAIVWDEFVGFWITMIAAPAGWQWILAGFVLFRFFDIVKPWPINWLDKHVDGGLGIMLDDIIAGLMAFLCLQLWLII